MRLNSLLFFYITTIYISVNINKTCDMKVVRREEGRKFMRKLRLRDDFALHESFHWVDLISVCLKIFREES